MTQSASINLWECLTALQRQHEKDPDNSLGIHADAAEMVRQCSLAGGFGSELTLDVDEFGTWHIRIFHHQSENGECVELSVWRHGAVKVERVTMNRDVKDTRVIRF